VTLTRASAEPALRYESSRLVMVHTAVRKLDDSSAEAVALWRGVVKALGG